MNGSTRNGAFGSDRIASFGHFSGTSSRLAIAERPSAAMLEVGDWASCATSLNGTSGLLNRSACCRNVRFPSSRSRLISSHSNLSAAWRASSRTCSGGAPPPLGPRRADAIQRTSQVAPTTSTARPRMLRNVSIRALSLPRSGTKDKARSGRTPRTAGRARCRRGGRARSAGAERFPSTRAARASADRARS